MDYPGEFSVKIAEFEKNDVGEVAVALTSIRHVFARNSSGRRFAPAFPRSYRSEVDMPGGIPSGLSSPNGSVVEPGRRIWKYPTPPTSLSFEGGAIVGTARLVLLFWGEFWQTATNPSVADIHQAADEILNSPYLREMTQYGFLGLSLDPPTIVLRPGPAFPTYSSSSVRDMVWALIDDDVFPEPQDDNGRIIYMVFAPQGTRWEKLEDGGAHGQAKDIDFPGFVEYAWVAWVNHGTIDQITATFTHELVETISDPEDHERGWVVDGRPEHEDEIADVCNSQTGFVGSHTVAAYFSDRLKSCVVPSFPFSRSLDWKFVETNEGRLHPIGFGATEATKGGRCFSGTYTWELFGVARKMTVTATATGYEQPVFEWQVNGQTIVNASVPFFQTITSPQTVGLDPLSRLTDITPATVSVTAHTTNNVLVMEIASGEPAAAFDVSCTVKEFQLPDGYGATRAQEQSITLGGSFRLMDQRFQDDLAQCIARARAFARKLIEEHVIPQIDRGDPPPPWVERALVAIEGELKAEVQEAEFLAHFISGANPELASELRDLTSAVLHTARATEVQRL
jgi:hypothetical protein